MLSGRGIDGELKSKFGELTEKFWKSGDVAGGLRAIYLTSGGGSGGQALSALRSDGGKNLISTESEGGEKVKSIFGICTNGQSKSSCQGNKNDAYYVVLVGDEGELSVAELRNSWRGWSLMRSEMGNFQNKNRVGNLKSFSDERLRGRVVNLGRGLQVSKLRGIFEGAETVEGGRFKRIQAWFCPDGSGGVGNNCRQGLTGEGVLKDDSKEMNFSEFFRTRLGGGSLWKREFKNERDRLVSLMLLLELWNQRVSENGAVSVRESIQKKFTSDGFSRDLSRLRLLTYSLSNDGSYVEKLSVDDNARVREVRLTQAGDNKSGSELVIGNFGGHLGVKFGVETISSDWFGQLNSGYLTTIWREFGLSTEMVGLFDVASDDEERAWLLIALLLSASFDLREGISVSVSPISRTGNVILQSLRKK